MTKISWSAIGVSIFYLLSCFAIISGYSYPSSYRGSTCRDRVANCNRLRTYRWCQYYVSYMSTSCRKTCGFCIPVAPEACMDTYDKCDDWARAGHCKENEITMNIFCTKSCGKCKGRPTVPQSTCMDRHRNCVSWARSGQCNKNPRYMLPYCPKSCGQCQRVQVVNGKWGSWGAPSTCSQSCGGGTQARYRTCNNPAPKNGGRACVGISKQTMSCNTQSCIIVVDGNWSSWGLYGPCSTSCGPGIKTRNRKCNNPAPQNGGKQCVGIYKHSESCKIKDCLKAIDGNWGSWSTSLCSLTCGSGIQSRVRKCDNPPPQNGGSSCQGKSREVVRCNTQACPTEPIDGKWSNWGTWTQCSRSCNGGFKSRYRECDNPFPSYGGQPCDGFYSERVACNTQRCTAKTSLPAFACGVRRNVGRIVGGSVANTRDWPWQTGLKRGSEKRIYCGGSLIDREWVLTAAHCIYGLDPSRTGCVKPDPRLRVVLGEFDVNNRDGHEVDIDVAQMCMHPNYDHRTLDYDIALLRLARPVMNFNQYIRPICMPTTSYVIPIGQNCSVTGFGKLGEGASLSNTLRQAKVPVKVLNYCKNQYPTRLVTNRMICAGYEGGQIDSCKGDSGGPFVCPDPKNKSRFVLAGAVSWGVGCARPGQPGLYTNIKYFLPWIKRILKNN
ncbi:A disintegrin and metalloproteinase with thrombospondin motifs adt-1-like isoform X2 [Actinia tenebrosa]|uniref:A disintegrin and metalloproteinase with thrombospondin motifs adt-1-like isoform X2 n=1 Tax=Actinia tenebrosa TaxID=6105 RepID=A0A6P8HYK3_ACTTE|nr:A disintegrin and metalloproteinase with thrombospondin motifs adt-1-like isoform X2 [Actinia tenebrosa]